MAERATDTPEVIRMDDATKARLVKMDKEIGAARKAIAALKKIGMDVSTLEDKLEWAEEARKILMEEFG